ncbi:MAG: hypothetical protein A3J38_05595 [Gammaproteobacteria bacterium RIFCSPHIGHO2_12_FULL_45_9]|nr:MAG: hypothetical protein A3J38_05595 [Gammaproteobacteria bacterium RIFCSPHIGHO2_12_FULL_45_9]
MKHYLSVSEMFYSIQGEGVSVGCPAVFLRLGGCNLRCEGFSYRDSVTGEHLGCDTKAVWRHQQRQTFLEILAFWECQGWLSALRVGAHLVVTGGEPLMHQGPLLLFLEQLDATLNLPDWSFLEIETNATLMPEVALLSRVQQLNVSPKLAHSGESRERAYQSAVLKVFAAAPQAFFKFVVRSEADLEEIIRDYVEPFQLSPERVLLMPEGGTRAIVQARAPRVVEWCKRLGFRYTPRLHLDIWDQATGV